MFNQTHIRVLECNWTRIGDKWNDLDIYSSFWRIYVNKCDGASVTLPSGRRFGLKGNTMFFIPAWVRFLTHTPRLIDHLYIHFDLIGLNNAAVREVFTVPVAVGGEVSFDGLVRRLGILREERNVSLEFTCRIESLIFNGLAEMIGSLPDASRRLLDQALVSQSRFSEVLRYIDHHPEEDLSNSRLAKISHLSMSHFVRMFKSAVGQSPASYVLQQRMARAVRELVFTATKIEQVAEQCGFANRFHFSRHFRRIMGISPALYRKTTRA
jgi:AraC-like DNA-binding protein